MVEIFLAILSLTPVRAYDIVLIREEDNNYPITLYINYYL